jgi:hypothetical protein
MAETLEDPDERQTAIELSIGWRLGQEFAAAHPEEALEIGRERVPEDCENLDVARVLLAESVRTNEPNHAWGWHDYAKYEVMRDSVAAADVEGDFDLQHAFPNDYVKQMNQDNP